jgi:hypothetical protein
MFSNVWERQQECVYIKTTEKVISSQWHKFAAPVSRALIQPISKKMSSVIFTVNNYKLNIFILKWYNCYYNKKKYYGIFAQGINCEASNKLLLCTSRETTQDKIFSGWSMWQ